jgi:mono/diheme cytochrome c family protein
MRRSRVALLFVVTGAASALAAVQQPAAPKPPPVAPPAAPPPQSPVALVGGAYTFRTYCASCHGVDAKGDGPLSESLRYQPPDLTRIAKRHGGEFPAEKVIRIVDGRSPLKGHGGPDMPIWGDAFRNADTGYDDAVARAKVREVVEHLRTIQEK